MKPAVSHNDPKKHFSISISIASIPTVGKLPKKYRPQKWKQQHLLTNTGSVFWSLRQPSPFQKILHQGAICEGRQWWTAIGPACPKCNTSQWSRTFPNCEVGIVYILQGTNTSPASQHFWVDDFPLVIYHLYQIICHPNPNSWTRVILEGATLCPTIFIWQIVHQLLYPWA